MHFFPPECPSFMCHESSLRNLPWTPNYELREIFLRRLVCITESPGCHTGSIMKHFVCTYAPYSVFSFCCILLLSNVKLFLFSSFSYSFVHNRTHMDAICVPWMRSSVFYMYYCKYLRVMNRSRQHARSLLLLFMLILRPSEQCSQSAVFRALYSAISLFTDKKKSYCA